jgi:hypothetical protein
VLTISGGYGVLTAGEPIGWYDAAFNASWWPGNVVADCLSAYAASHNQTSSLRSWPRAPGTPKHSAASIEFRGRRGSIELFW